MPCTSEASSGIEMPGLTRRWRTSLRPSGKILSTAISTMRSRCGAVPVASRSSTASGRSSGTMSEAQSGTSDSDIATRRRSPGATRASDAGGRCSCAAALCSNSGPGCDRSCDIDPSFQGAGPRIHPWIVIVERRGCQAEAPRALACVVACVSRPRSPAVRSGGGCPCPGAWR